MHSGLLYSESLKGSLSYCSADTWKPPLVFKKLNWNNASPSCLSALDQGPQWTCICYHSSPAHWFRLRSPGNLIFCQLKWFRCSVQSDDSGLSWIPNYIRKYLLNYLSINLTTSKQVWRQALSQGIHSDVSLLGKGKNISPPQSEQSIKAHWKMLGRRWDWALKSGKIKGLMLFNTQKNSTERSTNASLVEDKSWGSHT